MKNLLILASAFVLSFALLGCSDQQTETQEPVDKQEEEQEEQTPEWKVKDTGDLDISFRERTADGVIVSVKNNSGSDIYCYFSSIKVDGKSYPIADDMQVTLTEDGSDVNNMAPSLTDGSSTTWTISCTDNPDFSSIEIIYDETQQYVRGDGSRDRYDFESLKLTIEVEDGETN